MKSFFWHGPTSYNRRGNDVKALCRLWDKYPTDAFVVAAGLKYEPIDTKFRLTAIQFEGAAAQLRQWSSRILTLPAGVDACDDNTDHQLRSMLRWMDQAADAFSDRNQRAQTGKLHDTEELLDAFRMCSMFRSMTSVECSAV